MSYPDDYTDTEHDAALERVRVDVVESEPKMVINTSDPDGEFINTPIQLDLVAGNNTENVGCVGFMGDGDSDKQLARANKLALSYNCHNDLLVACQAIVHATKLNDPSLGAVAATLAERAIAKVTG